MAVPALLLGACSSEEEELLVSGDGVTFEVSLPADMTTRAFADGYSAKQLKYAVYTASEDSENIGTFLFEDTATFADNDNSTTVNINLVKGKKYDVIFWAQNEKATCYTWTVPTVGKAEAPTISIKYDNVTINDESRDAFFGIKRAVEVKNTATTEKVTLYRPFAQINVGTDDIEIAKKAGIGKDPADPDNTVITSSVKVNNVYSALDLFTGKASKPVDGGVTFAAGIQPTAEQGTFRVTHPDPKKSYEYMSMNYVLTGIETISGTYEFGDAINRTQSENVTVDLTFYADNEKVNTISIPNVPIQRNYRTNIYGSLLTSKVAFEVTKEEEFFNGDGDEAHNVLVTDEALLQRALTSATTTTIEIPAGTTINLTEKTYAKGTKTIDLKGTLKLDNAGALTANGKSANLTIKGGTLKADGTATNCPLVAANNAQLTLEDVIFEDAAQNRYSINAQSGASVNIKNSNLSSSYIAYASKTANINIDGGSVTANIAGIQHTGEGNVNVSGSTTINVNSENGFGIMHTGSGKVSVDGATINVNGDNANAISVQGNQAPGEASIEVANTTIRMKRMGIYFCSNSEEGAVISNCTIIETPSATVPATIAVQPISLQDAKKAEVTNCTVISRNSAIKATATADLTINGGKYIQYSTESADNAVYFNGTKLTVEGNAEFYTAAPKGNALNVYATEASIASGVRFNSNATPVISGNYNFSALTIADEDQSLTFTNPKTAASETVTLNKVVK